MLKKTNHCLFFALGTCLALFSLFFSPRAALAQVECSNYTDENGNTGYFAINATGVGLLANGGQIDGEVNCPEGSRMDLNASANNYTCDPNSEYSQVICQTTIDAVVYQCCGYGNTSGTGPLADDPCSKLTSDQATDTCRQCMYGTTTPDETILNAQPLGFWTGIGCISTNPMGAVVQLTTFFIGIAGVFIFFQILIGAFTLMTSKGNPGAVQKARERITNSILALLLIIFSVTILQFIGVNILRLPGFFDG